MGEDAACAGQEADTAAPVCGAPRGRYAAGAQKHLALAAGISRKIMLHIFRRKTSTIR